MATSGQERFWQTVRAWLAGADVMARYATPGEEDPEALLSRAQQEMRELHARNRDRAVRAITQKNNLQQIVDDTQKRIETLQEKAELAARRGEEEMAGKFRAEAATFAEVLEQSRQSLAQAVEASEAIKEAIRREEQRLRLKTSQAMALRTQWKALQLQQELVRVARASRAETADGTLPRERGHALLSQAVRQRDELGELTERTWREVESLREKAILARDQGREETERALLREMEQAEAALVTMRDALAQAVEVTSRAGEYLAGNLPAASVAYLEAVGADHAAEAEPEDPASYALLIGFALLLAALALGALWLLL
ncbi:MAG: PspA/IM30 family protein [Cytophagales bacterium]|nr:PspA/IM30 family protein [Armatimonadota bacterium]